jgi:hypothetical protein
MSACLNCNTPTDDDAEFCSAFCLYQMEAELEMPLAGHSVAEAVVEAAEAETRRAADGRS